MSEGDEKEEDEGEGWDKVESVTLDDGFVNQGHGMYIEDRIKLGVKVMAVLKKIIDDEISPEMGEIKSETYSVIHFPADLKVPKEHIKLKDIPVVVEQLENGNVLVKVGPFDLSGVGGHQVREEIIKDLVNQALKKNNIEKSYEEVNVSASIGVRGRAQMIESLFIDNRDKVGSHMNAYVKTANESQLTHWEPRNGPQSFFNDTICSMVTCVVTSLFEQGIRTDRIHSSQEATQSILKNPELKETFNRLLDSACHRITNLINDVKNILTFLTTKSELSNITRQDQKEDDSLDAGTPSP